MIPVDEDDYDGKTTFGKKLRKSYASPSQTQQKLTDFQNDLNTGTPIITKEGHEVLEHSEAQESDSMSIKHPINDIEPESNKCFRMEFVVRPTTELNQDVVLWDGLDYDKRTNVFEKIKNKRDWTAYNNAQKQEGELINILLKELCDTVPEPERKGAGRPPIPISEQIFCAVKKVYGMTSSRRAYSAFKDSEDKKHISHAPHYNSVSKTLLREDMTDILRHLIRQSALPLKELEKDFAVDSSGFSSSNFGAYCMSKHGITRQHNWIKAHICVGVKSQIVTDTVITHGRANDSPFFIGLVENTAEGFIIEEVSADKAYSSKANLKAVYDIGAVPYIPFKKGTNPRAGRNGKSRIWKDMYHYFQLNREEFDKHYHKRSNVESAFGAIKKKLSENLKSKSLTSQKNELLCKILANNITVLIHEMHRSGIKPDF